MSLLDVHPNPKVLYECMLYQEGELIHRERRYYPGLPIVFVAGPLSADDEFTRVVNLLRLGNVIIELSTRFNVRCANQTRYNLFMNPHDPGDLDLKFEIFYRGVIELCDFVVVMPGYERSSGCLREIAYARALGKPVYLLDLGKLTLVHEARSYLEQHWPIASSHLADLLDFSEDLRRKGRKKYEPITFLGRPILNRRPDWQSIVTALP